jgi:hypothetical protein
MARKDERIREPSSGRRARFRIRAVRHDDVSAQLERRLLALRLRLGPEVISGDCPDPLLIRRLGRALRTERRAARSGTPGYDLLRHLALVRLSRTLKRRNRPGKGSRRH